MKINMQYGIVTIDEARDAMHSDARPSGWRSFTRRLAREEALAAVRSLTASGARPRAAATAVAKLTGLAANELYRELTRAGQ